MEFILVDRPLRPSKEVLSTTELKEAEDKLVQLSKAFMDVADPIVISDLEGTVIELNRAAEYTYGLGRTELIGKSMTAIVPPGLRAFAQEFHERCMGGEKLESVETIHATKSGAIIPVLVSLSPITTEKGKLVGAVTMVKDVSHLRRARDMLRAQIEALELSNKDLEEFAYLAAHDLREPLIGIVAYIKLLERHLRPKLDERSCDLMARTIATITRMENLIETLLWYSSLVSEPKPLEPADCNQILGEALSRLRAVIEENEATIKSESLPIVVANPTLLVQVFQNLISNAIRFAGEEPLEIRIGATLEGSEWRFFVRDNGIGIDLPYLDRVFHIFYRIEASADRPGTGIGLACCKKIIECHGGRIWVDSKPGKGSTFFFTIPDRISPAM